MLSENDCMSALLIHKKIHAALSELQDLTQELSSASQRRDEISIRMFLSMRQEQINLLLEYEKILDKQCRDLKQEDRQSLERVLKEAKSDAPVSNELAAQVMRNRQLLSNVRKQDKIISKKLGGPKSYYKD